MNRTSSFQIAANPDTTFLKLIAVITMAIDHIGAAFFPELPILRFIGRLSFPIFAYCIAVGSLHTHDFKRYILRLAAFAVISQPLYSLAFHPDGFWAHLGDLNIFFTLILGALCIKGLQERNLWLSGACLILSALPPFDYGLYGVALIVFFFLFRSNRAVSLFMATFWITVNSLSFSILGLELHSQIYALLALPLIYTPMHTNVGINRTFFYLFYPLHLLAIWIVRINL